MTLRITVAARPYHPAVRIGAIAAGWLADLGLSLLFFAVLYAIVGSDGAPPAEVASRVNRSLEMALSSGLVGLTFTGVGGYVAALLARQRHVEHAIGVGLLSLGLALSSLVAGLPEHNGWVAVVGMLLTVPFAAAGGWYRKSTEKAVEA